MGYILTGRDEDGNEYLMHYGTNSYKSLNKSKIKKEKKKHIEEKKSYIKTYKAVKKANTSFEKTVKKGRVDNLKSIIKRKIKKHSGGGF